ncbi:MAG: SDR family NAD(P)-dependent oxidoreductase, partial [Acidimicrobiales bacterium]
PSFMWEPVEAVAATGVEGLDKGRPLAIPGAANRVAATLAHLTPKRLLVPILARQHPGLH